MFSVDFADVRPSFGNFIIVGFMASLFILLIKYLAVYAPWKAFKSVAHAL